MDTQRCTRLPPGCYLAVFCCLAGCQSSGTIQTELATASVTSTVKMQPLYVETRQVLKLVADAAAMIQRDGEAAFAAFRTEGSKWFHDDTYVFVNDMKGICLCHPVMPGLEGASLMDQVDVNGKRFVSMMIQKVSGQRTAGWVHYKWPRPGESDPIWKSCYVMGVSDASGTQYIVGSGLYDAKVEELFLVETVDEAAALVTQRGRRAFSALRDMAGPFRYKNVYVFVHDRHGTELVNPAFPDREGQNLLDFKDANGKPVVRAVIDMLETSQVGWMNYMWPRPGETEPSKKLSYVRKIRLGSNLYVGAGLYRDCVTQRQP